MSRSRPLGAVPIPRTVSRTVPPARNARAPCSPASRVTDSKIVRADSGSRSTNQRPRGALAAARPGGGITAPSGPRRSRTITAGAPAASSRRTRTSPSSTSTPGRPRATAAAASASRPRLWARLRSSRSVQAVSPTRMTAAFRRRANPRACSTVARAGALPSLTLSSPPAPGSTCGYVRRAVLVTDEPAGGSCRTCGGGLPRRGPRRAPPKPPPGRIARAKPALERRLAVAGSCAGPRVEGVVHAAEGGRWEVRVDLGRRDVGVAQHGLHGAEVGAVLQQVAGERVTKHVGRDAAAHAGHRGGPADDDPERLAREGAAAQAEKEPSGVSAPGQPWPDLCEVSLEPGRGLVAQRDQALLAALARADHVTGREIYVLGPQSQALGRPHPGGVKQLQHRPIAQSARAGQIRALHERGGRAPVERARQRSARARALQMLSRIVGQMSIAHEMADESANGGQPSGQAGGLETRPTQVFDVIDHVVGTRSLERAPSVVEERKEVVEIVTIGGDRVGGCPALGLEPVEEFGDGVGTTSRSAGARRPARRLAQAERVEHSGLYQRRFPTGKIPRSAVCSGRAKMRLAIQKIAVPPTIAPTSQTASVHRPTPAGQRATQRAHQAASGSDAATVRPTLCSSARPPSRP